MVGLILLYFVGKAFYDMAVSEGKSKWLFAILGVASYYTGLFIGGLLLAIGYELFLDGSIDEVNETALSALALPFGVLACWGFYTLLKKRWSNKQAISAADEILDTNMIYHGNQETITDKP
jgi:hypothetical protein